MGEQAISSKIVKTVYPHCVLYRYPLRTSYTASLNCDESTATPQLAFVSLDAKQTISYYMIQLQTIQKSAIIK